MGIQQIDSQSRLGKKLSNTEEHQALILSIPLGVNELFIPNIYNIDSIRTVLQERKGKERKGNFLT